MVKKTKKCKTFDRKRENRIRSAANMAQINATSIEYKVNRNTKTSKSSNFRYKYKKKMLLERRKNHLFCEKGLRSR